MNMWLDCDIEVAEVGSRRLCRMGRGLLKEKGWDLGGLGPGEGVVLGMVCL